MKFNLTPKVRNRAIVAASLFAISVPSYAIFGLGDIVFDPSVWAEQIIQKSQQVEMIAKLESQLQTAIDTYGVLQKSYTTATNNYNQVMSNAQRFGTKSGWITSSYRLLAQANVTNKYGETNGFTDALSKASKYAGNVALASSYIAMDDAKTTALMNGNPTSNASAIAAHKAQLAVIEASDAISPACLTAVGTYTQQRNDSAAAMDILQQDQYDESDDTNSEVEQLNMTNASLAQHLNELQAQGALHSCIAQQMTVANMQQRNATAAAVASAANIAAIQAASNNNYANSSYTWTHYTP